MLVLVRSESSRPSRERPESPEQRSVSWPSSMGCCESCLRPKYEPILEKVQYAATEDVHPHLPCI